MKQLCLALLTFCVAVLGAGTVSNGAALAQAAPSEAPLVPSSSSSSSLENSVVRLHVSKRQVDRSAPWQFEGAQQQSYLAMAVGKDRLLTTAWAVADGIFLELQRFGDSKKVEAEIVFADYEVNLAVVRPKAVGALAELTPLTLGDDLGLDESVEIYRARDAYQLLKLPGSLQEVGIYAAVTSDYTLVSYLLKLQQTGLGWAEPVLRHGKLVAVSTGQDNNYVHAVPASIIKHFLEDTADAQFAGYRGFPSIGIALSALVSPDVRRLLKAESVQGGVRIAQVMAGGPFSELLEADDVLLEVDGTPLSEHGFFPHPRWGKMHLKYLLNRHYAGDEIKVKVLRDGAPLTLAAKLDRYDSNRTPVVGFRYGEPEPHLIFGGLLFQELSEDYLKQWGRDWQEVGPLELLYALEFENDPKPTPGARVLFVSRVLADEFNRGYDDLRNAVVDEVNGRKVDSLASLAAALAAPVATRGRQYARIKFRRDHGEVVLAYDGLAAAHKRLAKTYDIDTASSFFEPRLGGPP